jgi:hypothetical protein
VALQVTPVTLFDALKERVDLRGHLRVAGHPDRV